MSIPQDVQAEAHDRPVSLFAERTWHVARPLPERSVIARAAEVIASAAAADHRRRWCALPAAEEAWPRWPPDRHPGRRESGRQGLAALRPPAVGGRHRFHGHHGGQPCAGVEADVRDRDRYPLQRFHGVADRVQQPRRPVRQHQRRVAGPRSNRVASASSPTPARPWTSLWAGTRSAEYRSGLANWLRSGTIPSLRLSGRRHRKTAPS